jgi:uncharacterized protein (DUF1800 family)
MESAQGQILRAVLSQRQLETQMTDFWFNHFNVWIGNVSTRPWLESYVNQALRPYALGNFRALLGTTARHPAMLRYLDNWLNTGVGTPAARGNFQGLNENYARELLELHTLGVDGGYSQTDVIALAKIFTGWGFPPPRVQGEVSGAFYFDPKRHDFSDKVFLGQTIKGTGMAEGEQALDILARHPATARHISYKLAQYFVADQPPPSLVNQLAQRYLATNGDIRQVLTILFKSAEFWNPQYYGAKFKTPYQYLISGLRATGANSINTMMARSTLIQMGMPVYGCSTPDGYKNTRGAWLNPDGMMRRLNIAVALGQGHFSKSPGPGSPVPIVTAEQLTQTLGDRFSSTTQSVVNTSPSQLQAALLLGSPEFMKR